MSLKTRFLVATVAGNFFVMTILSLTIIVQGVQRRKEIQRGKTKLVAKSLQNWIQYHENLIGVADGQSSQSLATRNLRGHLKTSDLFSDWIVVGPDEKVILNSKPGQKNLSKTDRKHIRKLQAGRNAVLIGTNRVYFQILRGDGKKYTVATELQDFSTLKTGPYRFVVSTAIVMGIGTILLGFVMYLIYNRLLFEPLSRLAGATEKIADSNYDYRLEEPDRDDEIGSLFSAFNSMMNELESYQGQLEQKVEQTRKRMERTQRSLIIAQRLSAMGTLASGIAHEINNPLGGMMNAVRSLKDDELSSEKKDEYLELIEDALTRIQTIVQKVLDFAHDKDEIDIKEVDVKELLDKVINLEQYRAETDGITIETDFPGRPAYTHAAPTELQQAFLNILSNAIEALEQNPAEQTNKIEISIEPETMDGEQIITISDTGPGMDDEEQNRAFDPFYTTKENQEGTGLGLSITHRIIENHGGRIELDSTPGEGTTVRVFLPGDEEEINSITKEGPNDESVSS